MPTHYDRRGAQAARSAVLNSRNRFWKRADIDAPDSTTQHLLADLVQHGELRHIRKGLYWRGTKTPLGMAPPSPAALAAQLTGQPGIGPAGLSAANALRLSTQIPRWAEYAVPARPPTDAGTLRFVNRAARRGRADYALSQTEVAALEVLDGWDRVIETGPQEAMSRLQELISSGGIDASRLAGASETEPASARARLRHLLTQAGLVELAEKVPAADPRTEARALAGLAA
ncbi:hypothetical protein [[Mycobacterium] fortunisiensis]|nr:hypothetical protein [[Mycobacterium] fortunisiensis]